MVMINNFSLEDNIIGKLYDLIDSSIIENREIGTYFYEYNGTITIDIPGVVNEFFGTNIRITMTPRFDTIFNPVGSFHTHLYNDMPSTMDITELIESTKEDMTNRRRFSTSIMSIGGIPVRGILEKNIKCYLPKFLNGKRSRDELLRELNNLSGEVYYAGQFLKPYMRQGNERIYARMNEKYMSPIINKYFDTIRIFLKD